MDYSIIQDCPPGESDVMKFEWKKKRNKYQLIGWVDCLPYNQIPQNSLMQLVVFGIDSGFLQIGGSSTVCG